LIPALSLWLVANVVVGNSGRTAPSLTGGPGSPARGRPPGAPVTRRDGFRDPTWAVLTGRPGLPPLNVPLRMAQDDNSGLSDIDYRVLGCSAGLPEYFTARSNHANASLSAAAG